MSTKLLHRVVVPPRLALIRRGGETLGYNPRINRWDYLEEDTAEVLRWLRAGREPNELGGHLARRFGYALPSALERLDEIIRWCILRRLLYLDREPDIPPIEHPPNPLETVYWICTQACNLRCTYCYQSAARARPNELATDEALSLVDQVVELGANTFIFTGGEPFVRPDLLEIANHSRDVGLQTNLITNGSYIDDSTVGTVASTFDSVTISLDHGLPEHHDCNRGEGTWLKSVEAIDLLIEAGVNVEINSTLSREGLAEVRELLAFVRRRRIGDHRIVPQFPMGRAQGNRARRGELTPEQLLGLNERMQEAAVDARCNVADGSLEGSRGTKMVRRNHCGAGLSEIAVDPEGWVYPCKLLQYPQFRTENVRNQSLTAIVANHPRLRAARGNVVEKLHPCKTCIIKYHCGGGCRGIHFSFTHDYIQAHPMFCAYLRRTFEAKAWQSAGRQPGPRKSKFAMPPMQESEHPGRAFVPVELVKRREDH
jgi:radical SAM protein with 4Fe4S-binding SPASM domain